jgi:hypothetical protein
MQGKDGKPDAVAAMVWMVLLGVCEPDGKRAFANTDEAKVREFSVEVLKKLATLVKDHNGMGEDDAESDEKNSVTTTS